MTTSTTAESLMTAHSDTERHVPIGAQTRSQVLADDNKDSNAVIATYQTHEAAEEAVRELERTGVDMKKLSIVGKDYYTEEEVVGYYTTGDRMKKWGKLGAAWGGFWGILFGSAVFVIPGIGPLLVAGPLVGWIIAVLESAVVVGGLSALGAGLISIGLPRESVVEYETQIKAGMFIVIAHGSDAEVRKIAGALATTDHRSLREHSCCA